MSTKIYKCGKHSPILGDDFGKRALFLAFEEFPL